MNDMVSIKIDKKKLEVAEGTYLLQAARDAGVEIPALCHYDGLGHFTSCMVCVVKDAHTGDLLPSCSVEAREGMEIITMDEEIFRSRKAALELLLSDHTGDCQAPCQVACPAHMDIPLMNRLLSEGKVDEALRIVERDIPIPSVLGRICQAPCEGACRRKTIDEPVAVCLLKRYAGDFGNPAIGVQSQPAEAGSPQNDKKEKVAVIGSGPAGLTAAYYLRHMGYSCCLFEKDTKAGGLLHEAGEGDDHYREALEREVKQILATGIDFRPGVQVDKKMFAELLDEYDAVIVATGEMDESQREWGVETVQSGFTIDKGTFRSSSEKVFVIGNAVRSVRSAVRSVGHGKEAAVSVDQFLSGQEVTGYPKMFNSRFGKLLEPEFVEYLKESHPGSRIHPGKGDTGGFSLDETKAEASRCMHCDCRDIDACKLRIYSGHYEADQKRFSRETRKPVRKIMVSKTVIYEPSKCIKCGICVRLAEQEKEKFGFTFVGRGFEVEIGIPFGEHNSEDLKKLAEKAAKACPTGALSIK